MKTDEQVIEDHDDLEYIKRPHLWPNGVLMLKKRHRTGQGCECAYSLDGHTVFVGYAFMPKATDKEIVYHSPEDIIKAGWVVD